MVGGADETSMQRYLKNIEQRLQAKHTSQRRLVHHSGPPGYACKAPASHLKAQAATSELAGQLGSLLSGLPALIEEQRRHLTAELTAVRESLPSLIREALVEGGATPVAATTRSLRAVSAAAASALPSLPTERQAAERKASAGLMLTGGGDDEEFHSDAVLDAVARFQQNIEKKTIARRKASTKFETFGAAAGVGGPFPAEQGTPEALSRDLLSPSTRELLAAADDIEDDEEHERQIEREKTLRKEMPALYRAFVRFDANNNSEIESHELKRFVWEELCEPVGNEELAAALKQMDSDGNGSVSFVELAQWMQSRESTSLLGGQASKHARVALLRLWLRLRRNSRVTVGSALHMLREMTNAPPGGDTPLAFTRNGEAYPPPWWLIHPASIFHSAWDLFVAGVLMLTVITLPLSLAFEEVNAELFVFNFTVDLIFLCDIAKNFLTGYVDEDDVCVMTPRRIRGHYLFSWFVPDLLSSIPIDFILELAFPEGEESSEEAEAARGVKAVKMFRLLRMAKLFRLLRMGRIFIYVRRWRRRLEDKFKIRVHEGTLKMIKLAFMLILVAHWVCRLLDYPPESWVAQASLEHGSVGEKYLWTFFKALGQMIGLEFDLPTHTSCELLTEWCQIELWITLVCLYIGWGFTALLISNVSTILFSMNMASRLYEEKTSQVNEYMRAKRLPADLRDKVRDYYALRFVDAKVFDEAAIMAELSPVLRKEIMKWTAKELFKKVPLFANAGSSFVSSVATKLRAVVSFPGEVVVEEGTTGDTMYFVYSGLIEIFLDQVNVAATPKPGEALDAGQHHVITTIGEGCFFGEVALLLGVRRTASARSVETSVLNVLDEEDLFASLASFPEVREYLTETARKRLTRRTEIDAEAGGGGKRVRRRDAADLAAAHHIAKLREGGVSVTKDGVDFVKRSDAEALVLRSQVRARRKSQVAGNAASVMPSPEVAAQTDLAERNGGKPPRPRRTWGVAKHASAAVYASD